MYHPRLVQRLDALWHRLTEPSSEIRAPEQRQQARLIASLLLLLIVLGVISVALWALPQANDSPQPQLLNFVLNAAAVIVMIGLYWLSRTRRYLLSVALSIVLISVTIFLVAIPDVTANEIFMLDYLVIPIFLCSIFLSLRTTALLLVAQLAGLLIFGATVTFPGLSRSDVFVGPLALNVILSCIILLAALYRDRLEHGRQTALRESETKFRMLIEQASDGIVVMDRRGRFVEVNSALCQMLGYTQEEMLTIRAQDVAVNMAEATVLMRMDQLRAGQSVLTEVVMTRKDGNQLTAEVSVKMLPDGRTQAIARNVSARKAAEEALRRSEQRFSKAFHASPVPFFIMTLDDERLIDANDSFFQVFGLPKEAIGQPIAGLEAGLNFTNRAEFMKSFQSNQPLRNIETIVTARSGETRVILVSTELIDLNGQPCALCIIQDITERKSAEEALLKERSLLRTLIDNLPDYIFIKDAEGRFLISNAAHSRAAQVPVTDLLVGRTASELFPADFAGQFQADDQSVLQSGQPLVNAERTTIGEDGNPRWVLTTKVALRDPDNHIIGLVGISRDITERKQADNRFRSLLESAPDAMVIVNRDGTIVLVNSQAEHLFGYLREELIGQPVEMLIPDGMRSRHPAHRESYMLEPHPREMGIGLELNALRKDGSLFPVEISLSPIETEDGTLVASAIRDITARKQAEEILHKFQDAEHEQRVLAEALRDTAAALTSALNPDVVMQRILENLGRVVAHDAANIMLIEGDMVRIAYQRGYPSEADAPDERVPLSLNSATLREMIISSAPCVVPDVTVYPGWVALRHATWVRSYVGAPLRAHGSSIGFINLDSATPNFFTRIHAERLQIFADQAAIAIENAQLYDELLHHATRLELYVAERTGELLHAKERVEAILRNSSDAVAVVELDGMISQTNPAFSAMFGYQPDEALGQNLSILAEPDIGQALLEAMQRVIDGGQPRRLELLARHQSGSVFSADVALSPIRKPETGGADGGLSGIVCSIRDVTERRRAEEALAQERNLLRTVVDNVPDFIYVKDTRSRFLLGNASVARNLNTTPDELVGKTDADFVSEDLASHYHADEEIIIQSGQPLINHEEPSLDPQGNRHIVLTTKVPLFDSRDRVIGLVGTGRDITRSKQIERELQELNRLKTEFLSTAAHELRTPLTSIRGFSEILLSRSFDADRQRRYLSLIYEQSTELGKLIDDLLDITRLESRRGLALEFQRVDLDELLRKATLTFAESAPRHTIQVDPLPEYPPIMGDPFRLMQVVNNLLSNAVKYSPKGGTVTIRSRLLADAVELCVQDEGIGMTANQQEHLFEKFYRADASNTTISGTGLGLSICKLIIELHGGKIWVDSDFGIGTKSYFTLPLAAKP